MCLCSMAWPQHMTGINNRVTNGSVIDHDVDMTKSLHHPFQNIHHLVIPVTIYGNRLAILEKMMTTMWNELLDHSRMIVSGESDVVAMFRSVWRSFGSL